MRPRSVTRFLPRPWYRWIGIAALAPLAVGPTGDYSDSSATRFAIAAGSGSYAIISRGCDGQVISSEGRRFDDAAATLQHEFRGPLVLGVRVQQLSVPAAPSGSLDQVLWNPYLALEGSIFGAGVGLVNPSGNVGDERWPTDFDILPVSAHLRFGDPRRVELIVSTMEGEPYFSSGGTVAARVGVRVIPSIPLVMGGGGGSPYDKVGFLAGTEIQFAPGLNLGIAGRLGSSEGLNESAIRVGLAYTWVHRRYDFSPSLARPDSGGPAAMTITLESGATLAAASIQPWSMGYIRAVEADGHIRYISGSKVRSIVDATGVDLTKRVLKERRRVP